MTELKRCIVLDGENFGVEISQKSDKGNASRKTVAKNSNNGLFLLSCHRINVRAPFIELGERTD